MTVAPLVLDQPMRIVDLSLMPGVPSLFDRGEAQDRPTTIFLQDFMRHFRASVKKDSREHIEYVPTQIVTEYIRRVLLDRRGRSVQGVIYPSAIADGKSCVLFVEAASKAQFDTHPADKWLKLDESRVKTHRVKG